MGIMGTIEAGLDLTSSALKVAEKILDKMPTYNQQKIQEVRDLRLRYDREMKADIENRDDNLVCHLRDKCRIFLDAFAMDIDNIKEIKLK